jgi:hypothetical protein
MQPLIPCGGGEREKVVDIDQWYLVFAREIRKSNQKMRKRGKM